MSASGFDTFAVALALLFSVNLGPMPAKKRTTTEGPNDSSARRIILEKIEAQNRMTIEAVNTRADALERKLDDELSGVKEKLDTLETVVRSHSQELRTHGEDLRVLRAGLERVEAKVDKLTPLEERVAALEKRSA
jgi:hypothetical protein